jgi:drug/metabolite transporter (DMT)-like permease
MTAWILVAVLGGILSLAGLSILFRRYREGVVTLRHLLAFVVGFVALASYALVSTLRPDITSGPVTVLMLLPAFVAIVVLIHEHQRAKGKRF